MEKYKENHFSSCSPRVLLSLLLTSSSSFFENLLAKKGVEVGYKHQRVEIFLSA